MRDTLRADLLDPYRRARVRPINQRALALFDARLAQMRARWPSLDEQVAHTGYATALLAALWHTLWADNQAGLDLLAQILPVLAIAHPATAAAAAAMTGQFEPTFSHDQRRDLDLLTQPGYDSFVDEWLAKQRGMPAGMTRQVRITLSGLAAEPPGRDADAVAIGTAVDREVAIMILRAGIHAKDHDDQSAIAYLRAAAIQATSTRLRQAVASRADTIARQLIWSGPGRTCVPSPAGMEAAEVATRMRPDLTSAWYCFGVALCQANRAEEGLAAYDQAITVDPRNASAHQGRGIALRILGRYEDALASYDQAIALAPAVPPPTTLGEMYCGSWAATRTR